MTNRPLNAPSEWPEWRTTFELAGLIKEASHSLVLSGEREWLRFVLNEASDNMRKAIIWAAESNTANTATLKERGSELMVAADSARGDALFASYCLDFMRSQDLIDDDLAASIGARLELLAEQLHQLGQRLRTGGAALHGRWEG